MNHKLSQKDLDVYASELVTAWCDKAWIVDDPAAEDALEQELAEVLHELVHRQASAARFATARRRSHDVTDAAFRERIEDLNKVNLELRHKLSALGES